MGANGSGANKPQCPKCGGNVVWKNGTSRAGKQQYRCKDCGRVFVCDPWVDPVIVTITDRMLTAEFAVREIVKTMEGYVSRRWIYNRRSKLIADGEI